MTATMESPAATDTAQSVTVRMQEVRDALAWVLPAAAKDPAIPAMAGVYVTLTGAAGGLPSFGGGVQGSGARLTVAATDRYRAHWATIVLPDVPAPEAPWSVLLPAREVAAAMKGWPRVPARGIPAAATVTLERADGVWRLAGEYATTSSAVSLTPVDGVWPMKGLSTIAGGALAAESVPGPVAFNGMYLSDLGKAQRAVAKSRSLVLSATNTPGGRPGPARVYVHSAEDSPVMFSAVLMPVRLPS